VAHALLSRVVSRDGFPADPDFPQLAIAADPGRMLEVFRAHLKPAAGQRYHIEDCIPFRFRIRQSTTRCVLQYTLRIAEPATGRAWEQWVTGLLYAQPGAAESLWRETRNVEPRRDIPDGWLTFEPVHFIPDLQMVVQVFPYDRKLRNLSLVLGGALRNLEPQLLERLQPGRGAGPWQVLRRTVEPTRYRTELGAALRYTIDARDGITGLESTVRCYLKVYRHDRGEGTFRLLRSLTDTAGDGCGPYAVVRPLAYLSDLRTLVLEEARGTALQQILLADPECSAQLQAVARAVAAFNRGELGVTPRVDSLADQLDDVRRAAQLLQWACPRARREVQAISDAVAQGLEEVTPAPIHRDVKTDHVFLSSERVMFIDLDSVALGDPVRDPAHLFAHIVARVGMDQLPRAQARAAARVFATEYFAHVPESWRKRFPLHCAGALVEVAGGIFKRQEQRWREKVAAAIAEARRALDSRH